MSSNTASSSISSAVVGGLAGIAAWLAGYAMTYVVAASDVRESGLSRVLEFFTDDPAVYELVGWVFYNAHFVDIVFENVPFVSSANYISGENGFTPLLYALPPAVLLAAGFAVAASERVSSPIDGVRAGLLVCLGYAPLSVVGVFAFEVTAGSASGAPDLLAAVFLAGVVFPVLFTAVGGATAAFVIDS